MKLAPDNQTNNFGVKVLSIILRNDFAQSDFIF